MSLFSKNFLRAALAGTALSATFFSQAIAGPIYSAPALVSGADTHMMDVKYNPRRIARRGGGNAAAATMLGILGLGIGAAIANSQRDDEYYQGYDYPGYGYPQPGYYEESAPVYAAPPVYYRQVAPVWRNPNEGNYWQQRARDKRDRNDM